MTLENLLYKELDLSQYYARIAGVNIPQNKIVQVDSHIFGIGDKFSKQICKDLYLNQQLINFQMIKYLRLENI